MNPFVVNIEEQTLNNEDFRRVLFTGPKSQLVLMSVAPADEIGSEIHKDIDQFIKIESGQGKAILDGMEYDISSGFAVLIPAGMEHNILNTSESEPIKIYTIYSPPEHKEGTVHHTRDEAMEEEE